VVKWREGEGRGKGRDRGERERMEGRRKVDGWEKGRR